MSCMRVRGAALVAFLVGCGGTSRRVAEPTAHHHGEGGHGSILDAALPYKIVRAHGGQEVSEADFLAELDGAQAICIGEHHPSPHDHWAQLHLFAQLAARAQTAGAPLAIGFEMFQRPFQGVLDDYGNGAIDDAALRSRAGWKARWGYDYSLYQPILAEAVKQKVPLLALNAAKELTKRVSHEGVDKLAPADKSDLPELVLDDAEHRAWWAAVMEDMGGAGGHSDKDHAEGDPGGETESEAEVAEARAAAERMYTAQVLWDESMADGAARWLAGGEGRRVVVLAGSGHCHESAIVRRIERRGVKNAVSIRPVVDDGEGNVAALLARPENDYVFVMTPP